MKIVIYGASGMIGQRVMREALMRGHKVQAIVRDPARLTFVHSDLSVKRGDILDADDITRTVVGSDVVVNATRQFYASSTTNDVGASSAPTFVDVAHTLITGLMRAGVSRLIIVGGAGSLEVAPGVMLLDTPNFPATHRPVARSLRDALAVYQGADLDWTFLSPALGIAPGERTGQYRAGTNQLLIDEKGESCISAEDYAVALLDEVETPRFIRQRFTVAY